MCGHLQLPWPFSKPVAPAVCLIDFFLQARRRPCARVGLATRCLPLSCRYLSFDTFQPSTDDSGNDISLSFSEPLQRDMYAKSICFQALDCGALPVGRGGLATQMHPMASPGSSHSHPSHLAAVQCVPCFAAIAGNWIAGTTRSRTAILKCEDGEVVCARCF